MIVTRQRKKKRNLARLLLPLAAIAAFVFAITWGPSRAVLSTGPTKPAWDAGASVAATLGRPLTFAAQQNAITDRNREIRTLNAQLEAQRQKSAAADAHAQQLQQQLATLQNQPKPTPVPAAPVRTPAACLPPAGGHHRRDALRQQRSPFRARRRRLCAGGYVCPVPAGPDRP